MAFRVAWSMSSSAMPCLRADGWISTSESYYETTPAIEALDDDRPVELLARGEYRRVAQLIAELEYPGVS